MTFQPDPPDPEALRALIAEQELELGRLRGRLAGCEAETEALRDELAAIHASRTWRLLRRLVRLRQRDA